MKANISNREKCSLVEVEVTFHPEAIREAFVGREGCLWKMMRMGVLILLFLLMLGGELVMPRFFPELPVDEWRCSRVGEMLHDDETNFDFEFLIYDRIR